MLSLEKQISELNTFDPRGANVFTLYLHTDPLEFARDELLQQLARATDPLLEDLPPHSRAALEVEIEAVRDYLGSMIAPPPAVALFTCVQRHFFRVIRLPVAVDTSAFWAPWTNVVTLLEVERRATELAQRPPSRPSSAPRAARVRGPRSVSSPSGRRHG